MSDTTAPEDLQPAPEDLQPHTVFIPDTTGTQTDAGKSLAPLVGAIFGYLAKQVEGHPIEQEVFAYAQKALSGAALDALATQVGLKGPITVKSVVDGAFAYLISVEKRPVVQFATRGLQAAFDYAGLPLLQAYLVSIGFPLPLA